MHLHMDPLSENLKRPPDEGGAPRHVRRSLPIALLRAREAVMSRFRPMLARHDINEQQWRVIRILDEHGELDASELASRAFVLSPSLTRMIRALEKRKMLIKRKDKEDGRRILLAASPKAKALIKGVTPESAAIYREIEAAFGGEEIEKLLALLDGLAEILADGKAA